MNFQQMRDFIDECRDRISSDVPSPASAVQLRLHPGNFVAKRRIHDQTQLSAWFTRHSTCEERTPLTLEQQSMTPVGRAMVIGLVAVFDEIMSAAEKGGYVELRNWIDIVQTLQHIQSFRHDTMFEFQHAPTFSGIYKDLKAAIETIAVQHQDFELIKILNDPQAKLQTLSLLMTKKIQEYLQVNMNNLLELFSERAKNEDRENFQMVKDVIDWSLNPDYAGYIAQGNQDLIQVKENLKIQLKSTKKTLLKKITVEPNIIPETVIDWFYNENHQELMQQYPKGQQDILNQIANIKWIKEHLVKQLSARAIDLQNVPKPVFDWILDPVNTPFTHKAGQSIEDYHLNLNWILKTTLKELGEIFLNQIMSNPNPISNIGPVPKSVIAWVVTPGQDRFVTALAQDQAWLTEWKSRNIFEYHPIIDEFNIHWLDSHSIFTPSHASPLLKEVVAKEHAEAEQMLRAGRLPAIEQGVRERNQEDILNACRNLGVNASLEEFRTVLTPRFEAMALKNLACIQADQNASPRFYEELFKRTSRLVIH